MGAVEKRRYKYMRELASLEECRPVVSMQVPAEWRGLLHTVESPLRVEEWKEALRDHPDREYVAYLTQGIRQGFRIGFNRELVRLKSARKNMQSAADEPAVIDAYLLKELACRRIVDPMPGESLGASISAVLG